MVAAAAALACAPETPQTLVVAAQSAYEHLLSPTASEDARYLVELLVKFGWLEVHGSFVSTPHDVVADEVLDQTIHSNAIVFEKESTAVLSCALSIPRGIGRLATALRRILGSMSSQDALRALADFLERWLKTNASALGAVLQAGDPDVTGYALGAVLSGPPWDESAIQEWDKLFLPWLNAHSTKEEARHLLYKGLKSDHAHEAALVASALAWLSAHSLARSATFVIRPLLDRSELSVADAQQAVQFALLWLEQNHRTLEARFVLQPLLERQDLVNEDAAESRRFALLWLSAQHSTVEAQFVLQRLLQRGDLPDEDAAEGRRFALLWLAPHHSTLEAGFVLKPLLERADLSNDEATEARRFALLWLVQHHSTLDAQFVFHSLLERADLSSDEGGEARRFALLWLAPHHSTLEAGFVLKPLLERADLSNDEATEARRFALLWLVQHHSTLDAQFVFHSLLERADLSSDEGAEARRFALLWLAPHHSTLEAGFVLKPLLERADLSSDEGAEARRFPLLWLAPHHSTLEAGFVLKPLLERADLSNDEATEARRFALLWLVQHHSTLDAGFVLPPLLNQELGSDDALVVVTNAVSWLQVFFDTTDAEFVIRKLFRRGDVPTGMQSSLLSAAIQRLRQRLADDEATFLLQACLQYRIDDKALQVELVSLAIAWLDLHPDSEAGDYVWNRVLRYRPNLVSDSDWSKVATLATRWLKRKRVGKEGVDQTTNSLLMRPHLLEPDDRKYVTRLAIELLGTDLHPQGRRRLVASLEWLLPSLSDDDPLSDQIMKALGS